MVLDLSAPGVKEPAWEAAGLGEDGAVGPAGNGEPGTILAQAPAKLAIKVGSWVILAACSCQRSI